MFKNMPAWIRTQKRSSGLNRADFRLQTATNAATILAVSAPVAIIGSKLHHNCSHSRCRSRQIRSAWLSFHSSRTRSIEVGFYSTQIACTSFRYGKKITPLCLSHHSVSSSSSSTILPSLCFDRFTSRKFSCNSTLQLFQSR